LKQGNNKAKGKQNKRRGQNKRALKQRSSKAKGRQNKKKRTKQKSIEAKK
jgi:hypothetical protein